MLIMVCYCGVHVQIKLKNLQKKAITILTNNQYHEHTEPLLKAYGLLKVQDIYYLKQLKFYYNLCYNLLPPYFHTHLMFLKDNTDIHPTYHLRPTVRPLCKYPKVDHIFVKSSVLYQLVSLFNTMYSTCADILRKIDEKSHSYKGFSWYVSERFLEKYSYECRLLVCYTCSRT